MAAKEFVARIPIIEIAASHSSADRLCIGTLALRRTGRRALDSTLSIRHLADRAGVSTRTVRYYVEQGLLPSPGTRGATARYGQGHLDRLLLIRRLQEEHLPLAEIRRSLENLSDDDVRRLLREDRSAAPPPRSSPLEYVRSVLNSPETGRSAAAVHEPQSPFSFAMPEPADLSPEPGYDRSRWDRVQIGPDIEIHIRRPLTRALNRRVDELIEFARNLLGEER